MAFKRPAATVAVSAGKRSKINPNLSKCEVVAAALQDASELPSGVREMLGAGVMHCLLKYNDDRHDYQKEAVGWIEKALASVEASLASTVSETSAAEDALGAQKSELEAALATAEETRSKLREAAQDAEIKQSESECAVSEAEMKLKDTKEAQEEADMETKALEKKKSQLEAQTAEDSQYSKWKMEAAKPKDAAAFVKALKKEKFEEELMLTLTATLSSNPAKRTAFDSHVLTHFEDALAEKIQALSKEIQEASPAREQPQASITEAEKVVEAAKAKNAAELEAAKSAQVEAKQADAAAAEAASAVKACWPAIAKAQAAVAQAKAAAEAFASGPRASFNELRDRQAPSLEDEHEEGEHEQPAMAEPADVAEPAAAEA